MHTLTVFPVFLQFNKAHKCRPKTVVTCKIKHLQNSCKNVLVFYFTCNRLIASPTLNHIIIIRTMCGRGAVIMAKQKKVKRLCLWKIFCGHPHIQKKSPKRN